MTSVHLDLGKLLGFRLLDAQETQTLILGSKVGGKVGNKGGIKLGAKLGGKLGDKPTADAN